MQAVGQCSICASRAAGRLLHSQTDASLLRPTRSTIRRAAACISYISSKPADQRLKKWADVMPTRVSYFSVGRGLCPAPFTQQRENLSHDSLIRRATSVVTNSSSTLLSQTTLALIDVLTDYSKAVHTLIILQRRYLASLGKLTPAEKDSLWQVIIGQRGQAGDKLDECKRFESTWVNSVNLCEMAADAAYSSGAEQASITVRANIQVAQSQVMEARKVTDDADKKLAETKAEEIQRMAEYTAIRDNKDEHDMHEAYLRED
ncbi:diablo IAP-binding mitochondrial protein-like isoform X2 [Genypterus blacodes]|uniref:diablo IAP-binding mitochondrial protein-like isoform X2 n=1 Tax=Genypterus blacodes TaxID=154954 RepID=UPI003F75F963